MCLGTRVFITTDTVRFTHANTWFIGSYQDVLLCRSARIFKLTPLCFPMTSCGSSGGFHDPPPPPSPPPPYMVPTGTGHQIKSQSVIIVHLIIHNMLWMVSMQKSTIDPASISSLSRLKKKDFPRKILLRKRARPSSLLIALRFLTFYFHRRSTRSTRFACKVEVDWR